MIVKKKVIEYSNNMSEFLKIIIFFFFEPSYSIFCYHVLIMEFIRIEIFKDKIKYTNFLMTFVN